MCSTNSAQLHACGYGLTPTCRELYRRLDFAFALATTANGGATVIRTSIKTITKPNMICLAFFGFSGTGQGWRAEGAIAITRLQPVIPGRLQVGGM